MKPYIILALLFVAGCASSPRRQVAPGLKGLLPQGSLTVQDDKNRPAAYVDFASGEVTYYATPEHAFEAMLRAHVDYVQGLRKLQEERQKATEPAKAKPAKPERKK